MVNPITVAPACAQPTSTKLPVWTSPGTAERVTEETECEGSIGRANKHLERKVQDFYNGDSYKPGGSLSWAAGHKGVTRLEKFKNTLKASFNAGAAIGGSITYVPSKAVDVVIGNGNMKECKDSASNGDKLMARGLAGYGLEGASIGLAAVAEAVGKGAGAIGGGLSLSYRDEKCTPLAHVKAVSQDAGSQAGNSTATVAAGSTGIALTAARGAKVGVVGTVQFIVGLAAATVMFPVASVRAIFRK